MERPFRDHVRDYWRGAVHGVQELATRLAGSRPVRPARPQPAVQHQLRHRPRRLRCRPGQLRRQAQPRQRREANRDGTDNNRSWNHGWEGETTDPEINAMRRRQVLNMMATQILAVGTPMLTAGDEFGRTQKGNNNAYCQDSPISWVNWDVDAEWREVQARVRDLIRIRQDHCAFRPTDYAYHNEIVNQHGENLRRVDLTWMDGRFGGWPGRLARRRPPPAGHVRVQRPRGLPHLVQLCPDPQRIVLPAMPGATATRSSGTRATRATCPRRIACSGRVRHPGRTVALMRVSVPTSARSSSG